MATPLSAAFWHTPTSPQTWQARWANPMVVSNQIFAKQKGHIKILPEETQAKMSKTARYFIVW